MRGVVHAQPIGVSQGLGIVPMGFDASAALGVQQCLIGVGDDHFVAPCHQAPRDPFTLSRGREQDTGRGTLGKACSEPLPLGVDMPVQDLIALHDRTNLTLIFVHIDPNLLPGWSPTCGLDRVIACGAVCYHVKVTSRFISSTRGNTTCTIW